MKKRIKFASTLFIASLCILFAGCDKLKVMIEDRIALKDLQNTCWEINVPEDMFPMVQQGTLYAKFTLHDLWIFNDQGFQAFYGFGTLMNQIGLEANGNTNYMDATLSKDKNTLTLKYTVDLQRKSWEGIMSGNALSSDLLDSKELADIELTLNKITFKEQDGYWLLTDKPVNNLDKSTIIWGSIECFMPDGRQISFYRNRPGQLTKVKEQKVSKNVTVTNSRRLEIGENIYEPWVSRSFTKDMASLLNWWTWKDTESGKIVHFTVPELGGAQSVTAKWQTYLPGGAFESESEFKYTGSAILLTEGKEEVTYTLSYSNGILTMESFKRTLKFTTNGNRTIEKIEKDDD